MFENSAKADFINFLMHKKYGRDKQSKPILKNFATDVKLNEVFLNYNSEFTTDELYKYLDGISPILETELTDEQKDIAFGLLYSCTAFTKCVKKKDFEYKKVAVFYKAQFETNKKYMAEYNKKDHGKVNISAPKNVVCRFPPEASGYLHIGHVKAALLNAHMAKDGKLILRFDDTNPEKEKEHYEKAIIEDLKLLGINDYTIVRSSDHFDEMYKLAIILIKKGLAYCDDTAQERMRDERMNGIASKCREQKVDENLKIFEDMNRGDHKGFCLRAKIDFEHKNKAMRDPVIYRYVGTSHVKTGDKYKIYPTYDFACPIVDSLDGVTLALRTNEYRDRNEQYKWFLDKLELKNKPAIHDFSRMNFENTCLSKRKIRFYVDQGMVSGWDDPRVATLRGIKRLGMSMDVLKDYIIKQGSSQKSSTISWDKVWALNKKAVDPVATRWMAVPEKEKVLCRINTKNKALLNKMEQVLRVFKNKEQGTRSLYKNDEIYIAYEDAALLNKDEYFTLMNWGVMQLKDKIIDGGVITELILEEALDKSVKDTNNFITWVSKVNNCKVKLFEYGNLQNNEETDDLTEKFNTESKKEEIWIGEEGLADTKAGEYVQILRIGFFICDKSGEFILLPYTKQKRT